MTKQSKTLAHYGVAGMRWGIRRANGGSKVSVGPGIKGAAKEIGGLAKDALKDDIAKVTGLFKKKEVDPMTKKIIDDAEKILNDPKSSKEDIAKALKDIGIDEKNAKMVKTAPVYNKDGKDVSVNPERRFMKGKLTDKEFDAEWAGEQTMSQRVKDIKTIDQLEKAQKAIAYTQAAMYGAAAVGAFIVKKKMEAQAASAAIERANRLFGPAMVQDMIEKGTKF